MTRRVVLLAGAAVVVLTAALVLMWGRVGADRQPTADDGQARPAVLLIPGYGGGGEPLSALQSQLAASGYAVALLDIGDGTGDLTGYGRDAIAETERLLAQGATSVSSVGFSAGGLIGRIAAVEQPQLFEEVISLASPHAGTLWALLGGADCPTACQQMKPGSQLLQSLPAASDAQIWLSVYSTSDGLIVPATSSDLPGATVLAIQDVAPQATVRHDQVPSDPVVLDAVQSFLNGEPVKPAAD